MVPRHVGASFFEKKFAKNLAERKKRRIFALAYKNKGV